MSNFEQTIDEYRVVWRAEETDNNTFERLATEDQVLSNASSSATAWYTTTSNDAYAAALAIFKPLVTGSGGGGSFTSADATSNAI